VQGRKSRFRTADDVEHLVRLNWAQGIYKFFITDDNFAHNKAWESIFDRLIELRERDGIPLGLMIQVDTCVTGSQISSRRGSAPGSHVRSSDPPLWRTKNRSPGLEKATAELHCRDPSPRIGSCDSLGA
jgi:hypothetical protein